MELFKRLIDMLTLGSDKPLRRLLAYYLILAAVVLLIFHFVPSVNLMVRGGHADTASAKSQLLQDGLAGINAKAAETPAAAGLDLALTAELVVISTLALMPPVRWVL